MGSYFLCISIKKKVSKFVPQSHFGLVIDIHSAVPIFGCIALKTFFSASQSAFSSSKSAGCRTVLKARGGPQAQPRGNYREGNERLILNFQVPGLLKNSLTCLMDSRALSGCSSSGPTIAVVSPLHLNLASRLL